MLRQTDLALHDDEELSGCGICRSRAAGHHTAAHAPALAGVGIQCLFQRIGTEITAEARRLPVQHLVFASVRLAMCRSRSRCIGKYEGFAELENEIRPRGGGGRNHFVSKSSPARGWTIST